MQTFHFSFRAKQLKKLSNLVGYFNDFKHFRFFPRDAKRIAVFNGKSKFLCILRLFENDDTDAFLRLKIDDTDSFLHLINGDTESRLRWKNDDPESVLRLKTTIPILSYV